MLLPATRCRFAEGALELRSSSLWLQLRGWPAPVAREGRWSPRVVCPTFRVLSPRPSDRGARGKQLRFGYFDPPRPRQVVSVRSSFQSFSRGEPFPWLVQRRAAFEQFRAVIPDEIIEAVAPFRRGQWALLIFLRYEPLGLELLRSSAGLAYLLALLAGGVPSRVLKLELTLGKRRRLAADRLGLPDRQAVVRRLERLTVGALGCFPPRVITALLKREDPRLDKLVGHLPSLNAGVVELVRYPKGWSQLTPKLLDEVAADPREERRPRAARILGDYHALRKLLPRLRPLGPIARIDQIEEAIQDARLRLERVGAPLPLFQPVGTLPAPPFPGIPGQLQPLSSPEALVEESLVQRNCVDGHVGRVARGGYYVYRMLRPARATLSVAVDEHGRWGVKEIKLRSNQPAPRKVEAVARSWLDAMQRGAR